MEPSDHPAGDFQTLVGRLRSGDADAARELLSQHEGAVRRYLRVRMTNTNLRRQMDSTDICQSVMADFYLRASMGLVEIQRPEQLIQLLATMARNRLINHVAKIHASKRDARRTEAADVADWKPVAGTSTPSQIVAGRELYELCRRRLSPAERDLAERRSRGETWDEIAQTIGGTPDALRIRLDRALSRVAAEFQLAD